MTHAYNPKGEWTYQHVMSVNGKFQDIVSADLLEVADRFGVRRPQDVLADVRAAFDNWSGFAKDAGLSSSLRDKVVGIKV